MIWPKFHQAVSTALKIRPSTFQNYKHNNRIPFLGEDYSHRFIDRVFDQNYDKSYRAGLWFATGLQGQLSKDDIPALTVVLGVQNEQTMMGPILGFCISMRGSRDPEAEKIALLHLPQYYPPSLPESDNCPPTVQATALLAIGFINANLNPPTTLKEFQEMMPAYQSKTQKMLNELIRRAGKRPRNATYEYCKPAFRAFDVFLALKEKA